MDSINVGSSPNSRDGDSLRTSFQKINENFAELNEILSINVLDTNTLIEAPIPPTSKGQPGDERGYVAFDDWYLYFCVQPFTGNDANIWKRIEWNEDTW